MYKKRLVSCGLFVCLFFVKLSTKLASACMHSGASAGISVFQQSLLAAKTLLIAV